MLPHAPSARRRTIARVLVIALLLGVVYGLGYWHGRDDYSIAQITARFEELEADPEDTQLATTDFSPFWRVWSLLERKHTPISAHAPASDTKTQLISAISGLVASYSDPYTVFIPRPQAQAFKEQVNGSYVGIGTVIDQVHDGRLMIVDIMDGSPAKRAGLVPGDYIAQIDGKQTDGVPLSEVISRIRGPKGSRIALSIMHDSAQTVPTEVALVRDEIKLVSTVSRVISQVQDTTKQAADTVSGAMTTQVQTIADYLAIAPTKRDAQRDAYILGLGTFSASAVSDFVRDMRALRDTGTRGVIIDLRGNPGGYMSVAIDLASYFLPRGQVVLRERIGRDTSEREHVSLGHLDISDIVQSKTIVVLVDGQSASASEIFAGALQDHGVATIIGQQTYGKGSVQDLIDISDLGSLKITIARWSTPKGRDISSIGITPDIVVDDSSTSRQSDPYIDAAMAYIKTGRHEATPSATHSLAR